MEGGASSSRLKVISILGKDVSDLRPEKFSKGSYMEEEGIAVEFPPLMTGQDGKVGREKEAELKQAEEENVKSWAQVVCQGQNSHGEMNLQFMAPEETENKQIVKLTMEDIQEGVCISGKIKCSGWVYSGILDPILSNEELCIEQMEESWGSGESKNKALEQSPWPVASKMLFLKLWHPNMDLQQEEFKSIPIWIRLPGLKLLYYTEKGLSKFASFIGKPLYTDVLVFGPMPCVF